jgi:hypothetical protein
MRKSRALLAVLSLCVFSCMTRSAFADTVVFDFNGDTVGTTFGTDTSGGLSLTYLASGTICANASGNDLSTSFSCAANQGGTVLAFSNDITSLTFDYHIFGKGTVDFDFASFETGLDDDILLTSTSRHGASGTYTFTGLDSIDVIFIDQTVTDEPNYSIDNVSATFTPLATTPEPSSIALLGTGMLGLAGAVRRRFKA